MTLLSFDPDRFLQIQTEAVSVADPLSQLIRRLLGEGAENAFFVGAGGAGLLMEPAHQLLRTRSTFPTFREISAELLEHGSAHLTASSIVVVPSLSGTTKESIAVMELAQSRGATVVTLTGNAESPLARDADATFTVPAADDTSSESFYIQSLAVALAIMEERGEFGGASELRAELAKVPASLLKAKERFDGRAQQLAAELQDDAYHIIASAGSTWPEAWYYGMCILEEMQWIRTRPVHASDFFHGTLELVEKGVSVLVMKGEDASRPLCDRVEAFAHRVTDRVTVIDTAEVALDELSDDLRALLSPAILATQLERFSAHLERARRHPLETRRYYRRLDY